MENHKFETTVYYEDTDAGGVVYHSNYLNFCERARSEIFFRQGRKPMEDGFHFVVKKLVADFIFPARLGDIVSVETQVMERKKASLTMKQVVYLKNETRRLFEMEIWLVCLHDDKIARIPESFLSLLAD